MDLENHDVRCSIFLDVESVIKKTASKIKEPKYIKERQYYTQDILLEAKSLLSCSNYDAENPSCLNCHFISHRIIQEYEHFAKDKRSRDIINKWLARNRLPLKRISR